MIKQIGIIVAYGALLSVGFYIGGKITQAVDVGIAEFRAARALRKMKGVYNDTNSQNNQ